MRPNPFPIFALLVSRRCVIVGGGRVGTSKAVDCVAAGGRVIVIAPRASSRIRQLAKAGRLVWHPRTFRARDVNRAFLVVAATDLPRVNQSVFASARASGALCNVVDDPEHCDFFYPAVVHRGPLQIAISTSGRSPALAHRLRVQLERQFGPEYAQWVEHVGALRRKLLARKLPPDRKRELLEELVAPEAFTEWVGKRRPRRKSAARRDG